ncbi:hypothetical protein CANARDRAFT_27257 [[Candida] arabinofermentans NRRL YB-2248]|uniref:Protein-lysine N-methyltransferase EFM6 n=1 Tax=[Candida] arabinofermentans NRRL YB-2248 TaxID=983967 RepID=A0A1E4T556_9ASCO|nr:hypothetical protein CANARDRAFT_27257 [[Candida] arabinofermentans NRRL YB-2248]
MHKPEEIESSLPPMDDESGQDTFFTSIGQSLVPSRDAHISLQGQSTFSLQAFDDIIASAYEGSNLEFDGLKIYEDGGKSGCGGVLWVAAEALTLYLLQNWDSLVLDLAENHGITGGVRKVVEIGSGTGITGIALGLIMKNLKSSIINTPEIYITDIDDLIPILDKNVQLNNVGDIVKAKELFWGEELPVEFSSDVDLILAADCVYNEKAFDILCQTLVDLSSTNLLNSGRDTVILFASRHRRKADMRFFKKARKYFDFGEITDYPRYNDFRVQNVHLFKMSLKKSKLNAKVI